MVLTNNQARVIGIEGVNLMPGSNVITGDAEKVLSTPKAKATIDQYKEAGIISDELNAPVQAAKKEKTNGEKSSDTNVTAVDEIRSLSAKDALKLVSTILDVELLNLLLKEDGRTSVQKVAKAQLDKVHSMAVDKKKKKEE